MNKTNSIGYNFQLWFSVNLIRIRSCRSLVYVFVQTTYLVCFCDHCLSIHMFVTGLSVYFCSIYLRYYNYLISNSNSPSVPIMPSILKHDSEISSSGETLAPGTSLWIPLAQLLGAALFCCSSALQLTSFSIALSGSAFWGETYAW
jgi:hypothetical protein